jgi:hypothetical protein
MPARDAIGTGVSDGQVNPGVLILGGKGWADRETSDEQGKITEGFHFDLKRETNQLAKYRWSLVKSNGEQEQMVRSVRSLNTSWPRPVKNHIFSVSSPQVPNVLGSKSRSLRCSASRRFSRTFPLH